MKKERAANFVGRIRDIYEKDILPANAVFTAKPSIALVVVVYALAALAIVLLMLTGVSEAMILPL